MRWCKILLVYLILIMLIVSCDNDEQDKVQINLPIILVTDFGEGSYLVAQLKGIILTCFQDAEIIDGTHSVTAFNIKEGAYLLQTISHEFPNNIVFIGIVDPGVPGEEHHLVLLTNRDQIFIAPDNGLLTYVYKEQGIKELYSITNNAIFDAPIESLFVTEILGRTGALIASGLYLGDVGPQISNPEEFEIQEPAIVGDTLIGEVVYIDNFGNSLTNIEEGFCDSMGFVFGDTLMVMTENTTIVGMFGNTYGDVQVGEPVIFVNLRYKIVEMAINMGNFSETYDVEMGEDIKIVVINK